jgi:hypothetical protein
MWRYYETSDSKKKETSWSTEQLPAFKKDPTPQTNTDG